MKKKVLSLAIIAASVFSATAIAQNPEDCNTQQYPTEGCAPDGQRGPCGPGREHRGPKMDKCHNPFEGINLTDAQKAKLDELHKKNQEAMKQKREERQKKQEEARVKRDSIMREGKLNQLRQIKEILTPEQYVTYLENMVVNQPDGRGHRMAPGKPGKPGDAGKPGRDDRRGHKPPKGDKKDKDAKKNEVK